jgi:hypothetical protein
MSFIRDIRCFRVVRDNCFEAFLSILVQAFELYVTTLPNFLTHYSAVTGAKEKNEN